MTCTHELQIYKDDPETGQWSLCVIDEPHEEHRTAKGFVWRTQESGVYRQFASGVGGTAKATPDDERDTLLKFQDTINERTL